MCNKIHASHYKKSFTITYSAIEYDSNYSEHRKKNMYDGAHETVPFEITLNKQHLLIRFYQPGVLKIYIRSTSDI